MRRDGDCSKCKYRESCNEHRARMCAEVNATYEGVEDYE